MSRKRSITRLFLLESKYEFLKALRMPGYTIPTLVFPLAFYVFFGVVFGANKSAGDASMSTHLLASYGAFGVIGAALFGFGVNVAAERGHGWLELKRATPMPASAYFVSKIFMSMLFGLIILLCMSALAFGVAGVRLPLGSWVGLVITAVLGTLPFCAMGLLIGSLAGPSSAPAITNLIFLPMSFLSGLWIPIQALPSPLRTFANALPAYHLGQLTLSWVYDGIDVLPHVLALTGFTVVFIIAASFVWRRGLQGAIG